jgi:hypothetical protein
MSRKIEIELTSARPDGSWTWRVAGAKQPKGVLDGSLLPDGAKVGDVLRAEADTELDGTVITSVSGVPPKREAADRLQLLSDDRPFEGVTTSLVPKGSRSPRDRDDRRPRPDRSGDRRGAPGPRRDDRGPGSGRPAAGGDRPGQPRRDRPAGGRPPREGDGPGSGDRGPSRRPDEPSPDRAVGRPAASTARRPGGAGERPSGPPKPRRLSPASTHRNAVLDSLAPEERPVAEQLLQGGIPAVRRAVQERNTQAREQGNPEVQPDALLALAEELLPRLKAAEWRDRAEAAAKEGAELSLRDLRSVVAGADAGARDDESRLLAKTLREALDRRDAAERDAWVGDITTCLDEGRVTRALRVAGRPPDPRTRFPAELATRLGEEASKAMAPDTSVERWTALLAAVLESPVRRSVKPVGLPAEPGDGLLAAARQASGRIPALASLLGLDMPPPPGPPRPGMRPARPGMRPPPGARRPPPPNKAVAPPPGRDAQDSPGTPPPARPEVVIVEVSLAPAATTPPGPVAAPEPPAAPEAVAVVEEPEPPAGPEPAAPSEPSAATEPEPSEPEPSEPEPSEPEPSEPEPFESPGPLPAADTDGPGRDEPVPSAD